MKALIGPEYYFSPDVFLREKRNLELWIFAGLVSDFQNENDYRAFEYFDIPIVVQKFKNELKAFQNICSHRFSKIQKTGCGNRAFFCPYHGWAYNSKGIPVGIPKKPLFDLKRECLSELKLKEYELNICGNLVFVNLGSKLTLIEYLGKEVFDLIQNFEITKNNRIDINEYKIKANWKLIVENTLEAYHVQLVHENTFNNLKLKGNNFKFDGTSSIWFAESEVIEKKRIQNLFTDRKFNTDNYIHVLLFPNTLISTYKGYSYNISQIFPLSEKTTLFKSEVYIGPSKEGLLLETYKTSLIEFNRRVFLEDTEICEDIQEVIHYSHQLGMLSDEEKRVEHFQLNYLKNYDESN